MQAVSSHLYGAIVMPQAMSGYLSALNTITPTRFIATVHNPELRPRQGQPTKPIVHHRVTRSPSLPGRPLAVGCSSAITLSR
jgi:hypothetical protein